MKLLSGRTINQVVWIFVFSCGLILFTSGCSTVLTVAYLFHPEDVPAEYNELRGKHVVVVCKPIVELNLQTLGPLVNSRNELVPIFVKMFVV